VSASDFRKIAVSNNCTSKHCIVLNHIPGTMELTSCGGGRRIGESGPVAAVDLRGSTVQPTAPT